MCILFTIVFQSCEKSELEETYTDLAKIEYVKSLSGEEQKVAFRFLNHEEKFSYRMYFINNYIANNKLNDNQLDLLEELKMKFNSRVYLKNDYAEYFRTIFITDWSNRALNYFSIDELQYIANSSYKIDANNSKQERLQRSDCKCHMNSIFKCTKKVIVSGGTGVPELVNVDVQTELVDCASSSCQIPGSTNSDGEWNEDTGGCGWFWMERCNGTC